MTKQTGKTPQHQQPDPEQPRPVDEAKQVTLPGVNVIDVETPTPATEKVPGQDQQQSQQQNSPTDR
jgi:hypothetical protein